jgi:FMN-dependent NADH-azoreductase
MICVVGKTFQYTATGPVGLATGKKVFVVIASGGVPIGSPMDFQSNYLKAVFGFLGITDVTILGASKGDKTEALAAIAAL